MELLASWTCPRCTTVNTLHNLNCRVCLHRKPGERVDHKAEQESCVPMRGVIKRSWTERIKAIFVTEPLEWTCPNCTLENGGYYTRCMACGFWRENALAKVRKDALAKVKEDALAKIKEDRESSHAKVKGKGDAALRENGDQRVISASKGSSWSLSSLLSSLVPGKTRGTGKEEEEEERGEGKRRIATDSGEEGEGPNWQCLECSFDNRSSADKCNMCDAKRQGFSDNDSFEELNASDHHDYKRRKLNTPVLDDLAHGDSPTSMMSGDSGLSSMPSGRPSPHQSAGGLTDISFNSSHEQPVANGRRYPTGHRRYHSNGRSPGFVPGNTPHPPPPHHPSLPSVLDPSHDRPQFTSVVTVTESETWKCSICGAYSLLSLPKCFVCGIGANPAVPPKPTWKSWFRSRKAPSPSLHSLDVVPHSSHMTNHSPSSTTPTPHPSLPSEPQPMDTSKLVADCLREEAIAQPPAGGVTLRQKAARELFLQSSCHRNSGPQSLLEASLRSNCTMLISEERQQAEHEASDNFQRIQSYCRKV